MEKDPLISLANFMMWACLSLSIKDVLIFVVLFAKYIMTNQIGFLYGTIIFCLISFFFFHMANKFRKKRNEISNLYGNK
jgi:hypothetical protein